MNPDPTSRRISPLPPGWKTHIRPRILARDGHRCTWVAGVPDGGHPLAPGADTHPRRCATRATDVDHIGDPDDHDERNLRALCGPHHDGRTALQANRARWSRPQARRQRPKPRHPGLR